MKTSLLAIDPGKDQGWACFRSDGWLLACGLGRPDCKIEDYDAFIIEIPEHYPDSKVDPNNLITLAVRAGVTLGMALRWEVPSYTVLPKQWKGQVDKEVHNKRTINALRPDELVALARDTVKVPAGKRNNVIDAIALGKWFLTLSPLSASRYRYQP